jgi:cyclic pyranopterin phosphate synthase
LDRPYITDNFGRTIDYLRLSVTDRCNLNCAYCHHSAGGGENLLTLAEISKTVRLFAECGIRKIRLTGGEPLVRDDIFEIVRICKETEGIREITLTTNGILLPEMARGLKAAGLDRVNISIDSLDPQQYKQIARADSLRDALSGVDAAINAGLKPVKLNTVLMSGVNDHEIDSFIALTKDKDVQVRFIEYMPMGEAHKGKYISAEQVVSARPQLKKYDETKGVETLYYIDGHKGKVGFIAPVSQPFCERCNRIRVTADCKIRHCLGDNLETDLREILKEENQTALKLIQAAIEEKPSKGFCRGFVTNRGMGNIGG